MRMFIARARRGSCARLLVLLAVAGGAASRAASAQNASGDTTPQTPPPISLSEAVRLAQRNAPLAIQARGGERAARAGVTAAVSAFVPNVNVSVGAVRQFTGQGAATRINPQTGATEVLPAQPWSYSNGLAFTADLFDGGRRFYDLRAARANVTAADANQVAQLFTLSLNVKQQFFAALAARESEDAARAQLAQAEAQLKTASARLKAGAATISDSLRAVILVGNGQLAVLTAQSQLRNANVSLTRIIGSPTAVSASTSDTVDTTQPSAGGDSAIALADSARLAALAANGPLVAQARSNLVAAREARRSARSPFLPSISASYSRAGSGTDPRYGFGSDPFSYAGRLGLSLSYPLFNQYQREQRAVTADIAEDNARAALRDQELAATQTLSQQLEVLSLARQRVRVQEATIIASREDLRVQQQRYELGASTLLDVLTSQAQLNQAEAALIQARYDARVARAQIEALIGRSLAPGGTP